MRMVKLIGLLALLAAMATPSWAEGTEEDWSSGLVGSSARPLGGLSVRGSGHVISEVRSVGGFSGVEIKGSGDLTIVRGRAEKLEIEAEDNILDLITSTVEGGVLVLDYSRGGRVVSVRPTRPVRATLTVRDIGRISAFGSGSVAASGLTGNLEVSTFGTGGIRLSSAWLDSLTVTIAGSGGVDAEGTAAQAHVSIAGSGDFKAPRFSARKLDVRIAGSGSASVGPSDALDITILGSGSVSYSGRPRVSQTVLGSGSIRSLDAPR